MRNFALEAEISAPARNLAGPLSYWRLLPASTFNQHRVVVETALVSIVSISRLAPDELIGELAYALEEERIDVWNDLCVRFTTIDRMDAHEPASKVVMRLKRIWPEHAKQLRAADLRANPSIRAFRKIRLYEGKKCAHSAYLHSVVDALAWASATWGEHPFVAEALAEAPTKPLQGASWLDIIQVEGRRRAVVDQVKETTST